jgi:hypothetical protein
MIYQMDVFLLDKEFYALAHWRLLRNYFHLSIIFAVGLIFFFILELDKILIGAIPLFI